MVKKYIEVTLIDFQGSPNRILRNILNSINTYLLRNKNNVSDFHLIKDISERNCEALDEEINSQLPIPLYLGLMGTMMGIIIGLLFIPNIDNFTGMNLAPGAKVSVANEARSARIIDVITENTYLVRDESGKNIISNLREVENLQISSIFVGSQIREAGSDNVLTIEEIITENTYRVRLNDGQETIVKASEVQQTAGVDILLGGVKIAMFSSFFGLLLTISASGVYYKGAKAKLGATKNGFYSFVQTELMPVLASDTASVIRTLEQNLNKFNYEFSTNTEKFHSSFSSFTGSVGEMSSIAVDFKELLGEIKKLNLLKLSKVNSELLQKISVNAEGLDRFNDYLKHIDTFIDNALMLNSNLRDQLKRTHSIEEIAQTISSNVRQNEHLIKYLESGLMEIESRKQVLSDSVISIDEQIQKSLKALEDHTQESIIAIKNITIKEEDVLEKLIKEDKENLGQLKNLEPIKESLQALIAANKDQNNSMDFLNSNFNMLNSTLQNQKTEAGFKIPKPMAYLAYIFLGAGAVVGIVRIGGWLADGFSFLINLF